MSTFCEFFTCRQFRRPKVPSIESYCDSDSNITQIFKRNRREQCVCRFPVVSLHFHGWDVWEYRQSSSTTILRRFHVTCSLTAFDSIQGRVLPGDAFHRRRSGRRIEYDCRGGDRVNQCRNQSVKFNTPKLITPSPEGQLDVFPIDERVLVAVFWRFASFASAKLTEKLLHIRRRQKIFAFCYLRLPFLPLYPPANSPFRGL